MARLPDLTRESGAFARSALQELSQLQRALRAAQDGIAGLRGAIKAPVIRTPRHTIKGSRSSPSSLLSIGGSLLGSFLGSALGSKNSALGISGDGNNSNGPGSFYQSPAQRAAAYTAMVTLGKRVR